MKRGDRFFEQFSKFTDLPSEPLPGMPLVELVGDCRVLIENHHGVTEYGKTQICVKVSYGHICVQGARLVLARMSKHQLVISGYIDCISIHRRRR